MAQFEHTYTSFIKLDEGFDTKRSKLVQIRIDSHQLWQNQRLDNVIRYSRIRDNETARLNIEKKMEKYLAEFCQAVFNFSTKRRTGLFGPERLLETELLYLTQKPNGKIADNFIQALHELAAKQPDDQISEWAFNAQCDTHRAHATLLLKAIFNNEQFQENMTKIYATLVMEQQKQSAHSRWCNREHYAYGISFSMKLMLTLIDVVMFMLLMCLIICYILIPFLSLAIIAQVTTPISWAAGALLIAWVGISYGVTRHVAANDIISGLFLSLSQVMSSISILLDKSVYFLFGLDFFALELSQSLSQAKKSSYSQHIMRWMSEANATRKQLADDMRNDNQNCITRPRSQTWPPMATRTPKSWSIT